mgnify:FL=1
MENNIKILEGNNSMETAIIVDNYPYGSYRTQIRYWIETTNKGDRFVSQTLNPKTKLWNKPKKSTYSDVMVLTSDEKGYIKYLHYYVAFSEQKDLDRFLERTKGFNFNNKQQEKLREARAILKVREHINFEIKPRLFKNKLTGEISESVNVMELNNYEEIKEEDNKEATTKTLNKLYNHYYKEVA